MKKVKLYVACGLFLAITVIKLVSPTLAGELRQTLLPAIERNVDYRAAMVELGRKIGGNDTICQVLSWAGIRTEEEEAEEGIVQTNAQEEKQGYFPVTIAQLRHETTSQLPQGQTISIPDETDSETEETEAETIPDVVASFLEAQAPYSDYAIPANVSYDMPELPFAYTTPVAGYTSSGFGYRLHPIQNEVIFHYGTDFAANTGTQILAFADGMVLATGLSDSYGNYIILDHGNGFQTLYAHCSEVWVSWGEQVVRGQCIGLVGATGQVTGPHLHFELMQEDTYLNPEFYLEA